MLLSAYSGHYCLVHPTSAFKNGGGGDIYCEKVKTFAHYLHKLQQDIDKLEKKSPASSL